MGEILRRLCYPLVLPAIVLTVWTYARTMNDHDGYLPGPASEQAVVGEWGFPPVGGQAESEADRPAPGYGFRAETNVFATVADDEP
jgi:hypothetical protein